MASPIPVDRRLRILKFRADNPDLSNRVIALRWGVSATSVGRIIQEAEAERPTVNEGGVNSMAIQDHPLREGLVSRVISKPSRRSQFQPVPSHCEPAFRPLRPPHRPMGKQISQ